MTVNGMVDSIVNDTTLSNQQKVEKLNDIIENLVDHSEISHDNDALILSLMITVAELKEKSYA